MKRSFFQAAVVSILLYGCTTWTLTKRLERRLDGNYTRMLRAVLNKSWATTPHETPTIRTLAPHHKNYTSSTNQTRGTLLEKQGRAHKRCTPCGPPLMDVQVWDDQHEPTYSSYVRTRVVILKTCRRRWVIGRNGERRSGISAQTARHDDDDEGSWSTQSLPLLQVHLDLECYYRIGSHV